MIFGFKDSLRQAVEAASGGLATVMYTPKGQPLFMRRITPFRLEDLAPDGSLGTGWHPAFPDGREFWVSIYRIRVHDGEPISVPGVGLSVPTLSGLLGLPMPPGMRFLSLLEYSALALMGTKLLGDVLRGNDDRGRNQTYPWETGVRADGLPPGTPSGNPAVLTGSGPTTWRRDHTPWGVELVGNYRVFLAGLRFKNGAIQFRLDGAALNPLDSDDAEWSAWDTEGNVVSGNASGILGYMPGGLVGTTRVNSTLVFSYADIAPDTGITIPPLMRALGLAPSLYTRGDVGLYHTADTPVLLPGFGGSWHFPPAAPGTVRGFAATVSFSALLVYRD